MRLYDIRCDFNFLIFKNVFFNAEVTFTAYCVLTLHPLSHNVVLLTVTPAYRRAIVSYVESVHRMMFSVSILCSKEYKNTSRKWAEPNRQLTHTDNFVLCGGNNDIFQQYQRGGGLCAWTSVTSVANSNSERAWCSSCQILDIEEKLLFQFFFTNICC